MIAKKAPVYLLQPLKIREEKVQKVINHIGHIGQLNVKYIY
jgi:hypothetical protein